jgi:glutamyl-tRNA synthetase
VPKHVLLYQAFGWDMPAMAHVPLLRNADKTKISKRKNPTSLLWYREQGYLPEALLNFLALQGWSPREATEEFTLDEFVGKFDPHDISVGGPVFDFTKLDWLNGAKIRRLTPEQLADRLLAEGFAGPGARDPEAAAWTREQLVATLPLFQERLRVLSEFVAAAHYLRQRVAPDLEGLMKKVKKADPAALRKAMLAAADAVSKGAGPHEAREAELRALAESNGLKAGDLFMALRVAVTGSTTSPPLLPSIDVIGAAESAARVRGLAEQVVSVP